MADGTDGTVARTLRLLGLIAEHPEEIGVKDLAQRAGLPQSTVHRLLALLGEGGFVDRAPGRRYRMGTELLRIARLAVEQDDLPRTAQPFMRAIVDACDETCLLAIYGSHDRTVSLAARIDCSKPLRYRIPLHTSEPLTKDATGLAILAFLPDAGRTGAAIDRIRRDGFVVSQEDRADGAMTIAAPVFATGHQIVGSLAVTLPAFRYAAGEAGRLTGSVTNGAAGLSRALGSLAR